MTSPDQPVESPSELLERAAAKLEELAFGFGAEEFWQKDIARADLSVGAREWAPVMGPAIAKPLVAWLRYESRTVRLDIMGSGDTACTWKYVADRYGPAIAFSKLILGEQ